MIYFRVKPLRRAAGGFPLHRAPSEFAWAEASSIPDGPEPGLSGKVEGSEPRLGEGTSICGFQLVLELIPNES